MKTLAESVQSERLVISEGLLSIGGCICKYELLKAVNTFVRMCFLSPLMHLLH